MIRGNTQYICLPASQLSTASRKEKMKEPLSDHENLCPYTRCVQGSLFPGCKQDLERYPIPSPSCRQSRCAPRSLISFLTIDALSTRPTFTLYYGAGSDKGVHKRISILPQPTQQPEQTHTFSLRIALTTPRGTVQRPWAQEPLGDAK